MIRRTFLSGLAAAIPFVGWPKKKPAEIPLSTAEVVHCEGGRNSWRTYRLIEEAVTSVNRGDKVIYVCRDYEEAGRCKSIAMSICQKNKIRHNPSQPFVLKLKQGKLQFVSFNSNGHRGSRITRAFIDHSVCERAALDTYENLLDSIRPTMNGPFNEEWRCLRTRTNGETWYLAVLSPITRKPC